MRTDNTLGFHMTILISISYVYDGSEVATVSSMSSQLIISSIESEYWNINYMYINLLLTKSLSLKSL